MDYKILVYFILINFINKATPRKDDSNYNDDDSSYEDEDKELYDDDDDTQIVQQLSDVAKTLVTNKPRPPRYEVTELVVDIPDDRTPGGPIITNFTVSKPLNFAPTTVPILDPKDDKKEDNKIKKNLTDTTKVETEKNIAKEKKNFISILHVKAEYDDKNKDTTDVSDFDSSKRPNIFVIKEYFKGIKQGIINGFNSILHKNKQNDENHAHDDNTRPFTFFNKIHDKSSDFAHKIHSHIFGEDDHF